MTEARFSLAWPDYVIFALIVCISLCIGIYHALSGSRQRTTAEFLVGDRKMNFIPVSLSYAATFMSSIFFLGTPAEMYRHGIQYLFAFYATIPANMLTAFFTIPLFHHLHITSAYEYLELRFDSMAVRRLGSCFGILTNVLYMSVVLYGPAVALQAVASFPLWASVLIIGLASIIYTAIGGIKAVVWTDVFQSLIMISGLVAIVIKSLFDIGGLERFWHLNKNAGRLDISFNLDPTIARTFWTCLFGGCTKWLSFGFNQSSVLRYVSIPSLSEARKMILWSTPTFLILATTAAFEGLCAFSFYAHKRCDPFEEGVISNSNEICPMNTAVEILILPFGLPGLFLASLFSASLSTLSSCLSSVSACSLTDFIRPMFPRMTEFKATVIAKLIVVFFGCLAIGLSFLIMQIQGTVTQIATSLIGAVDGPTCAMFILGGIVPWTNKYGVFTGGIFGIGMSVWVSLGQSFSDIKVHHLAPGPIDKCLGNISGIFANGSSYIAANSSMLDGNWSISTAMHPVYSALEDNERQSLTGLNKWYSLSFVHHTLLGLVVTLVVGLVVSAITGPTKPSNVNPAYVSPLVRRFFYSQKQLDDLENELAGLHDVNLSLLVQPDERNSAEKRNGYDEDLH